MRLRWTLFKYRLSRQKRLYAGLLAIGLLVFLQADSAYISRMTMLWECLAVLSYWILFTMKTRQFNREHKDAIQAIIDKG